jgi:hypothetical protein
MIPKKNCSNARTLPSEKALIEIVMKQQLEALDYELLPK